MTVYLSKDDGKTWKYKKCIDSRLGTSYPDVDFYDGRIYMVYDYGRGGANEILLLSFTEADIMDKDYTANPVIIGKP